MYMDIFIIKPYLSRVDIRLQITSDMKNVYVE